MHNHMIRPNDLPSQVLAHRTLRFLAMASTHQTAQQQQPSLPLLAAVGLMLLCCALGRLLLLPLRHQARMGGPSQPQRRQVGSADQEGHGLALLGEHGRDIHPTCMEPRSPQCAELTAAMPVAHCLPPSPRCGPHLALARSRLVQLLAFIGDAHGMGDEICGVVCSPKFQGDVVAVWTRHAQNEDKRNAVRYASHSTAQAAAALSHLASAFCLLSHLYLRLLLRCSPAGS